MTIRGVAETVRATTSGELSAAEAVEESLAAIERLDGGLNAISEVLAERARADAAARDAALASGATPGPLHGVPLVIKEEIPVEGVVTRFGGRANSTPAAADAEVVRRLRDAGAVVVATTRMPEFGAFPYTESDAFGLTRNPWDPARSPGGSSGGTAAAVASGMVPAGLGGDGGGSIRIPSAFCGLFGLKPQRGRVTTSPEPHLWWALGVVGPLTRSVLDSAMIHDVIDGNVPGDLYTAPATSSLVEAAGRAPGRLRIGWSTKPASRGVRPDPQHVAAVHSTVALLEGLGHEVVEVNPHYPDVTVAFVPQFFAGIRTESDAMDHFDLLEKRTRQTYRLGSWVTPRVRDFALRRTESLSRKANRVFDDCDVLLTPTVAHRPPEVGIIDGRGTIGSALRSLPAIAYVAIWNVAGNPAAAVPCGLGSDGLPTSVQLVGRTNDEATLVSLAAQIEAARPWPLLAGDTA